MPTTFFARVMLVAVIAVAFAGSALAINQTTTAQEDERVTESPAIEKFSKLKIEGAGDATISCQSCSEKSARVAMPNLHPWRIEPRE